MKPLLTLVFIAPCVFITACADVQYAVYEGPQDWQVGKGAFVSTKHGIPIYHDLPERPFLVLGKAATHGDVENILAATAKKYHAQAVVIIESYSLDNGSSGFDLPLGHSGAAWHVDDRKREPYATAWLINFKNPDLIRLDTINSYLRWLSANANGITLPQDADKPAVTFTATQIATRRIELEREKENIMTKLGQTEARK